MIAFPDFTFAFQPIVNVTSGEIVSFEALVRGVNNEASWEIMQQVGATDLHRFDKLLRSTAITLAARLGLECELNLNLMSGSIESSDSAIASTLAIAEQHNISANRITLEITEGEIINDYTRFAEAINKHRNSGLKIAIDDFGAGYAGLNLLAEFQPDMVKLDRSLVQNIDTRGPRQAIVRGVKRTCEDLGIDIIAEGVETPGEYWWFREEGIELFQGYLLAKPAFEKLPLAFYRRT
ncbi:MAG: EAL domain-containing protein [Candidatus Thiodiazotropha sp. (ex Lucinoma borealis)]|nr:EAL domain-containing protein [Candidatus Thiodiazotropha sp. (ex Lucinoma borealis)]